MRRPLWAAADEMRANSTLSPAEYRGPVLGLIFLAYAEHRFEEIRPELEAKTTARRPVTADDYRACSVLFVPDGARLSHLVDRSGAGCRVASFGVPTMFAAVLHRRMSQVS